MVQDEFGAWWRVLTAVDDIFQLLSPGSSLLFVNPVGLEPVVVRDYPKLDFAVYNVGDVPKSLLVGNE